MRTARFTSIDHFIRQKTDEPWARLVGSQLTFVPLTYNRPHDAPHCPRCGPLRPLCYFGVPIVGAGDASADAVSVSACCVLNTDALSPGRCTRQQRLCLSRGQSLVG